MHQPGKPLPEIWLMTDKRNDSELESAIRKLPNGSGMVFRHYHLDQNARAERFAELLGLAKRKGHLVMLADHPRLARKWGADGVHGRHWKRKDTAGLLHSAPVHDILEMREAKGNGVDLYFLSPAFATRSHVGSKPLGISQLSRLNQLCAGPVILLGGMNQKRFRANSHLRAYGWAAIDALSEPKNSGN